MIAFAAAAAVAVIGAQLFPEGEVATLVTFDARGRDAETQLWVAEIDGVPYLRSGSPGNAWLRRVRANPEVELGRPAFGRTAHGAWKTQRYRASLVEDPRLRSAVHEALARKYGIADRVLWVIGDREDSVIVRLDRRAAAPGATHAREASS